MAVNETRHIYPIPGTQKTECDGVELQKPMWHPRLFSPDFEEPALEGRKNVWKKFLDKYLKVTYKESEESILVVTAVNKNKGWR